MELILLNGEQLRAWANGRDFLYAVKGKAPEGTTYSDGSPIDREINVAWKDADTGEQFDLVYSQVKEG